MSMASRDSRELPRLEALEADYELVRELGRGATTVVYFARERAVDRSVAIKLIRPSFVEDDESAARLLQEAAVVGRLNHPNIVTLLGTRRLGDRQLALIFQYVPGMTLRERLRTKGLVPHAEARRILMDLGRALAHVHGRGIVHGNVSPRNIHLDGEAGLARLAGFGTARLPGGGSRADPRSAVLDRAGYMAPEGLRGEELDERSDVFSLGLVAYEMLTGEVEPHTPLAEHCPGLPPRMRGVIQRALRTDPNERWPDAEAFLAALGEPAATQADAAEDAVLRFAPAGATST
jgi:eukaryotic-like serine/threonine-protein kinase